MITGYYRENNPKCSALYVNLASGKIGGVASVCEVVVVLKCVVSHNKQII